MYKSIDKQKFPGLNNMTVGEVRIMAIVCKEQGNTTEQTWETLTCIDDCLTFLRSAALINNPRGNTRRRVTTRQVIESRIMAAKI